MWDSIVQLGRAYDDMMGFILYLPIGFLSLFSFVSELQTVLLFSKASTRGIQISRILAGQKDIGEF
jgi:callose synthase